MPLSRTQLSTNISLLLVALACFSSLITAQLPTSDWAQWGGPQRNFKSAATGLATSWPATGLRKLWNRELGNGYSSIAVVGGKLFTMYRKGEQDVVVALDAVTGKTMWEYAYDAPFGKPQGMANGPGPHATPLATGNYVFTTGPTGKLYCLDKKTGKLVWAHNLFKIGIRAARSRTKTPYS